MRKTIVGFLLYLSASSAFVTHRYCDPKSRSAVTRLQIKKKEVDWDGEEEWKDEDGTEGQQPIRMSNNMQEQLQEEVGKFVTVCTIKTYKGYLKNFNDELTQKWLTRFGDDEITADGLNIQTLLKRPWVEYFEQMIRMDPQEVKVLVRTLNGRGIKGVRGVKFNSGLNDRETPPSPIKTPKMKSFYIHKLEPRKIASALLCVREDVSSELLADLRCVDLENEEVKRYAANCLSNGVEYAEKNRRLSRMAELGGSSTPLRDHSYKAMADLITAQAIAWLREDDKAYGQGMKAIDEIQGSLETRFLALPPQERILGWYSQRLHFLEAVYLRGLTDRQEKYMVSKDEVYRTAQRMLLYRRVIGEEMGRIIAEQTQASRYFYKLIKDLGGFTKLDFSGQPKIFTVEDAEDEAVDELISAVSGSTDRVGAEAGEEVREVEGPSHHTSAAVPLSVAEQQAAAAAAAAAADADGPNLMDLDWTQPIGPMEM